MSRQVGNSERGLVGYTLSRFPKISETFILEELYAVEQQQIPLEFCPIAPGTNPLNPSKGRELAISGALHTLDFTREPRCAHCGVRTFSRSIRAHLSGCRVGESVKSAPAPRSAGDMAAGCADGAPPRTHRRQAPSLPLRSPPCPRWIHRPPPCGDSLQFYRPRI